MIEFGQDPTAVHWLPIPDQTVGFPRSGQYTFRLMCDDDPEPIARVYLDVR